MILRFFDSVPYFIGCQKKGDYLRLCVFQNSTKKELAVRPYHGCITSLEYYELCRHLETLQVSADTQVEKPEIFWDS